MHYELKTVATFEYAHFAHIAKTKLESEDVECYIFDEYTSSMNWFFNNAIGGIKLKVREEDYEKALKTLNKNVEIENEDAEIICPECNSKEIKDEKVSKKFAYISILLMGFPLLLKKGKYECKNCGFKWRKTN
jgi:DNA-directed RNA polymerase subunit RPC12/RpoP